jgi:predicted HicB family RNase H-like nuclease
MKYKGYTGLAEIDEDSGVLFGRVIGLRDVITFQGASVAELTQAFHDSVDDYLDFCAKRGESPEKPFSGHFVVRISPELHRDLSNKAESEKVSLNSLVASVLQLSVLNFSPSSGIRGTKDISPYFSARVETPKGVDRAPKRGKKARSKK